MPSPIAHCSLVVVYWTGIKRHSAPADSAGPRWLLCAAVLVALLAPDCDAVVGLFTGQGVGRYHNGPTHSLFCAPAFGLIFAAVSGRLLRCGFAYLFAVGATAYASHIFLDFLSWHRTGVQLFWPITQARFASPLPLFWGVRHSVNAPWWVHGITIATETVFAAALWIGCYWWRKRRPT